MNGKHSEKIHLETLKAETLIQRIARNVAWYALRIARPGYLPEHLAVTIKFVTITDTDKARDFVRVMEFAQSSDKQHGDNPPVPLQHVIFRG